MSAIDGPVASTEDEVFALEHEWRALAATSAEPSLFATPEWHQVWWAHFGGGRTAHLVGARCDGALVGLAPLCTKTDSGAPVGLGASGVEPSGSAPQTLVAAARGRGGVRCRQHP
jgi:hypothetical protein